MVSHLPITLPILDKLPSLVGSRRCVPWHSLPFYILVEMTYTSGKSPLWISKMSKVLNTSRELKITYGNFKHSYNDCPFSIAVSSLPQACPVDFLANYLAMWGSRLGTLFVTMNGASVSRSYFSNQLSCLYSLVVCPLPLTWGTAFKLMLLPMLQIRGYLMLKLASKKDVSLMPIVS